MDENLKEAGKRQEKLRKAAEPLIKLLCEDYHPHVTAIVTPTSVELTEGICAIPKMYDFIVD